MIVGWKNVARVKRIVGQQIVEDADKFANVRVGGDAEGFAVAFKMAKGKALGAMTSYRDCVSVSVAGFVSYWFGPQRGVSG